MLAPLLLTLLVLGPQGAEEPPEERGGERVRIGRVLLSTRDVYSEEEAEGDAFYRLVNGVHWTTRERVVRNEMWFGEGDEVARSAVAELERNLRATGLFASAEVTLREGEEPGTHDLVVDTRDRLSLVVGGAGSVAGGVGSVGGAVGESNLFGRGDRVFLSYRENDEGEERLGLSFTDRYFLDARHRLRGSVGETEEGPFWSLSVRRRFVHLQDPRAWGVSGGHREDEVDFFASGDTVAEVPRSSDSFSAFTERAWGSRFSRQAFGVDLDLEQVDYGSASGVAAGGIEVPGDTTRLAIGPFWRLNEVERWAKVENLDTLDFVQDLELGWRPAVFVDAVLRDEEGEGESWRTGLGASVRASFEAAEGTYVTMDAGASGRIRAGSLPGWSASGSVHAYHFASRRHTLAASLTYDHVVEREDLPPQLTLGEDNGLRGYPAREFAGTRRALLNLEDRIETGLEVASVHVDAVVFVDAGWIDGEPGSPDEVLTSVGAGLRLGSSELFGPGVLRVDLAVPLSDAASDGDDVSLSIAFGQVFTFFGNASLLPDR